MPERTPSTQKKPSAGARPTAKKAPAGPDSKAAAKSPAGGKRPPQKPGKSIVNQRQTPWGLVITTIVIVVFAVGIVSYAVLHKSSHSSSAAADASGVVNSSDPYSQPELPAAAAIQGLTYTVEPNHTHVEGNLTYDHSPPIGGNHSQIWADCSGTVYPNAIANENAVHMLEHGAVWITYKPGLAADQVATLSKLVNGIDRMAMSPYPDLKTSISLQAWGYQLFVDNASDPRIQQFITALRDNPKTTPEQAAGVSCTDAPFKAKPSTFGHPIWTIS
jgi:Protein of unknown function (DUF3105)